MLGGTYACVAIIPRLGQGPRLGIRTYRGGVLIDVSILILSKSSHDDRLPGTIIPPAPRRGGAIGAAAANVHCRNDTEAAIKRSYLR